MRDVARTGLVQLARQALCGICLVLAVLAPVATSPASETGALTFAPRRVSGTGGEVLLIDGARASDIRRVWFGSTESPSLAFVPELGMTVLVPSSELDRGERHWSTRVRVELADGSTRNLGRLGIDGYPRYRGRRDPVGGSFGYQDASGVPHFEMQFSSWSERIDKHRLRYRYQVRNRTTGAVRVNWATLELLGLPGGWEVELGPESTARFTFVGDGPAVDAMTESQVEGTFVSGLSAWAGLALVPASKAPHVAVPENVTSFEDTDGSEVVQWTHPDPTSLDRIDVLVASAEDREGYIIRLEPDATSVRIPPEGLTRGVNGVAVSAQSFGFGSRYILLGVVR